MSTGRVFVAGHNGMVGRAIMRNLGADAFGVGREDLDLANQEQVDRFFSQTDIGSLILAAARVGGIGDNMSCPADFGYENGIIVCNVLKAAHRAGIQRLLFLGSSCMYPVDTPQPMREDALLTAPLEPTNEMYGLAKIFGTKLCEAMSRQYGVSYHSLIPCNLYGPCDNFELERGHVIPSLIRRFHEARYDNLDHVLVWGDGSPLREFLHVDDLASACRWALEHGLPQPYLNCGSGEEISIKNLAYLIKDVVGFKGDIRFDRSKPNGIGRKLVDSDTLRGLGWKPKICLFEGLRGAYEWYLNKIQLEVL